MNSKFSVISGQTFSASFPWDRAKKIRLFVMDVDGVLTDGGLYYGPAGELSKRFDVQDGLGISLLRKAGIIPAIITGMDSGSVRKRAEILNITEYYAGTEGKLFCLEELMRKYSFSFDQVAFMGDDWIDLGPMLKVGLALAPANAQPEVKACAHFVSNCSGGHGAVRGMVRHILQAQEKLEQLLVAFAGTHTNEI